MNDEKAFAVLLWSRDLFKQRGDERNYAKVDALITHIEYMNANVGAWCDMGVLGEKIAKANVNELNRLVDAVRETSSPPVPKAH